MFTLGQTCIRAKAVVFLQSGCNRAKLLYLGNVFVFGQSGCIREKVVIFKQKWLYSCKDFVIGKKWLYTGKSGCIRAK